MPPKLKPSPHGTPAMTDTERREAAEALDYDGEDCWNCGGEGFVYGCSWDWQCDTWDGDSCLCTRPCEICHPPKHDPVLRALMAATFKAADCGRCHGAGVLYRQDCGASGLTVPCPECAPALLDAIEANEDEHPHFAEAEEDPREAVALRLPDRVVALGRV